MAVNERIISSNLDAPEGGTDGLLQAVVCDDVSMNTVFNMLHLDGTNYLLLSAPKLPFKWFILRF